MAIKNERKWIETIKNRVVGIVVESGDNINKKARPELGGLVV